VEFESHKEGEGLHGIIDRIDARGDERRVVDYKTRLSSRWQGNLARAVERGRHFQAPVYLALTGATHAVFVSIEAPRDFDPAVSPKEFVNTVDREVLGKAFEGVLAAFRDSMRAGRFFIRPDERGACAWCDYATVCRKSYGLLREKPPCDPAMAPYFEAIGEAGH
jgi:RecB family exonuclease